MVRVVNAIALLRWLFISLIIFRFVLRKKIILTDLIRSMESCNSLSILLADSASKSLVNSFAFLVLNCPLSCAPVPAHSDTGLDPFR